MIGAMFEIEENGYNLLQFFLMLMMFGCGLYANISDSSFLVEFMGWISPFRYAMEIMMRTILEG